MSTIPTLEKAMEHSLHMAQFMHDCDTVLTLLRAWRSTSEVVRMGNGRHKAHIDLELARKKCRTRLDRKNIEENWENWLKWLEEHNLYQPIPGNSRVGWVILTT